MRKKTLPLFAIASILVFSACSNEDILKETNTETTNEATRKISVTASINEEPTTYLGLEETADKNIVLTWEDDDALELAFVQGDAKAKSTVTLSAEDITNGGKRAKFDITVPEGIDENATFTLYGVFGGGGIELGDATTNPYAILPIDAGKTNLLSDVEARKHVMLHFKSQITPENPQVSVNFQHLGSLFSISFLNNGPLEISSLTQMRLRGTGTGQWAYNTDDGGGQFYDLVGEEFLNRDAGSGTYISFNATGITFPIGVPVTLWGWYPPLPDRSWPELEMVLLGTEGNLVSVNKKPARPSPTPAGKSYRFYAVRNGTSLNFTNADFVVTP